MMLKDKLPNKFEAVKRNNLSYTSDKKQVPENVKKFLTGKKYFIRTFGCQANVRDEEIMAGYLKEAGMAKTDDKALADVAIINTCAVRENAEDKVYGEIGSYKANYEKNKDFILIVSGCVIQEEGIPSSLKKSYPWVSLFLGTHELNNLLDYLSQYLRDHKTLIQAGSLVKEVVENLPSVRLSSYTSYVNISYGCDKYCTYCIVPYTRGHERSRKMEDILKECRSLVEDGYKEVTLLGQNVNSYGLDFKDGTNFATLLEEVAKLGFYRVRFLTSYPSQFTKEMMEVMAKYPNICKCLHLPVQSGSTSCLKRMGRRYTREEYLALVKQLKTLMPDLALTTDIIVGFPGETEEEFKDTLSLVKEVGYSSAFTFIYSPRPGTPAALMEQEPAEISHRRFDKLKEVVEECTKKASDEMVGKVYNVLITGPSKKNSEIVSSYTENGKLINCPGPEYLTGMVADVHIDVSHVYSLQGTFLKKPWEIAFDNQRFIFQRRKDLIEELRKAEDQDKWIEDYIKNEKTLQKVMQKEDIALFDAVKYLKNIIAGIPYPLSHE